MDESEQPELQQRPSAHGSGRPVRLRGELGAGNMAASGWWDTLTLSDIDNDAFFDAIRTYQHAHPEHSDSYTFAP